MARTRGSSNAHLRHGSDRGGLLTGSQQTKMLASSGLLWRAGKLRSEAATSSGKLRLKKKTASGGIFRRIYTSVMSILG